MVARADLHVHSKFSNRPGEWFLRQIGTPESFTEPKQIYEICRLQGMQFVTISDHNTIDGALEIAHLPGTFLSSEISAFFPEDGCEIHCLVLGVTEAQFREIDQVRHNIYEFRRYLFDHNILYSIAHPLFSTNDQLTLEHFEKILVMFKRFEAINGARDPRAATIARAIFQNLSPKLMEELANRHNIDPEDDEPWRKLFTGGSDDHSGLYIANAYTETPPAKTVRQFLDHIKKGESIAGGEHGTSLKMARNFASIAYRFYRERMREGSDGRKDLFAEWMNRVLEGDGLTLGRGERWMFAARKWLQPWGQSWSTGFGDLDAQMVAELEEILQPPAPDEILEVEERCFQTAARLSGKLAYATLLKLGDDIRQGRITECLKTLANLGPAVLAAGPYLAAFHTQHKDEALLRTVAERFHATRPLRRKSGGKAWFTDTLTEVNGVARTIQTCARLAQERGRELEVITSQRAAAPRDLPVHNFEPVGDFELPEYEGLRLAFPPFLEILEHCERRAYSEILISTPGPVGLAALLAGRLLGLRVTGIYHTDFPLYVRHLTESPGLEEWTWRAMRWFFNQMDTLYAPSRYYLERLKSNGFDGAELRVLPRGVDRGLFHPIRRDPAFFDRFGVGEGFRFLYVGRVSKEKNLDQLLNAFTAFLGEGHRAQLVVVGDGPHRGELKQRFPQPEITFTGFLEGTELATAYASADAFVFPSTTDTFGNAVLEAQASGLPALVTDRGGPREIVERHASGKVVDLRAPGALTRAMVDLYRDPDGCRRMSERALRAAATHSWNALFAELWQERVSPREQQHRERHGSIRNEDRDLPVAVVAGG